MRTPLPLGTVFLTLALPLYAQQAGGQGGPPPPPPPSPLLKALDADGDGIISAAEIANAPAALKTFDKNGDGKLTPTSTVRRISPAAPAAGRLLRRETAVGQAPKVGRAGRPARPDQADRVKPGSPWADKADKAAKADSKWADRPDIARRPLLWSRRWMPMATAPSPRKKSRMPRPRS